MRQIFLEDARPGDEVAVPVRTERGMVVLTKGSRLTAPLIDRMRRMGVRELIIEGDDPNAAPPKTLDERLAELDGKFEGREGSRLMMKIKDIAREHLLQRKQD